MRSLPCILLAAAAVGLLRGQQGPVTIRVPAATVPAVGELLVAWYGDDVEVEAVAGVASPPEAAPCVWLLWDEWSLVRATGAAAPAMPFVDDLVLVAEQGLFTAGDPSVTWEAIALSPALHDRLGLVAPEVDGGPWLAAMQDRLQRGLGEDAGVALWTTLDARAGRLQDSYAALIRTLTVGGFAAAIGPRRLFVEQIARGSSRLQLHALPGAGQRLGLAVAPGAGERARTIAVDLGAPERQRALAAAAGVSTIVPTPGDLSPARARGWWQRFETQVRGRGRGFEELADWLDLGFGIAFLVCAWLLWRALRKTG